MPYRTSSSFACWCTSNPKNQNNWHLQHDIMFWKVKKKLVVNCHPSHSWLVASGFLLPCSPVSSCLSWWAALHKGSPARSLWPGDGGFIQCSLDHNLIFQECKAHTQVPRFLLHSLVSISRLHQAPCTQGFYFTRHY